MTGDPRTDQLMKPVGDAIRRHIKWPSDAYTDIYNRAWEAVEEAIHEAPPKKTHPLDEAMNAIGI